MFRRLTPAQARRFVGPSLRFFATDPRDLDLVRACRGVIGRYKEDDPSLWRWIEEQVKNYELTGQCEAFGQDLVRYDVQEEGDFAPLHTLSYNGSFKSWEQQSPSR